MEYKIIKPFLEKLQKLRDNYLKGDIELSYSDLADAYLQVSRLIYYALNEHRADLNKLREGYIELLDVIQIIHIKKTISEDKQYPPLGDIPSVKIQKRQEDKKSIWNNRSYVRDVLGLYINTMQNLEQNEFVSKQIEEISNQNSKQNKFSEDQIKIMTKQNRVLRNTLIAYIFISVAIFGCEAILRYLRII